MSIVQVRYLCLRYLCLIKTDLVIRKANINDANAVAKVLCSAYGMPPPVGTWFGALIDRPRWHVFVAEQTGTVVACGALYVEGTTGWLGAGATLAETRKQGAQSAILAERIAYAASLGCEYVVTETGEAIGDEPNPSLKNIERVGFQKVCSRRNYAAKQWVRLNGNGQQM